LNGRLAEILEIVAESDQTPTAQATAAVAALRKSLDAQLAKWSAVKAKDLPALNVELQKAGLGAIEP
jgi:nucleoid DNA-binding protein